MTNNHQSEYDKPLVSLVMNTGSGHHAHGHEVLAKELKSFFMDHGYEVEMYLPNEVNDLNQLVKVAVTRHRHREGVIVAAGGDGTLNCVAQALHHTEIPLGIIPLGTFNYVARVLNIPLDIFEAAQVIVDGHQRAINIGLVNQYVYLNNASIGLYPKIIEQRETDNARFGRFRAVAMLSGFAVLMREQQKLRLQMIVDGQEEPLESPLIFFGNNQLQLHDMNLELAACVEQGKLAAVAITPMTRWQLIKLIRRLQRGTFEQAPEVSAFCADTIRIQSKVKSMKVAIDGEIVRIKTPLIFKVAHQALQVMVPHVTASI